MKKKIVLAAVVLALACASVVFYTRSNSNLPKEGFLATDGNKIIDSSGNEVHLSGINWFGFEEYTNAPRGLERRNMIEIIDQIKALGYNTIRLPYSNDIFQEGRIAGSVNDELNPEIKGLKPLQIMDKLIEECGKRDIKIILDRHRPTASGQSELWYDNKVSEEKWIEDWVMLAQRYKDNPTVIGADLHNEPHGAATWGTGDPKTDWKMAAEKCGNAILEVNPNWLIIVEGIENYNGDYNWWGSNLIGAAEHPIKLKVKNRLVYSVHEYSSSVHDQSYFHESDFPNNMAKRWDKYWGYIHKENIAPVLLGEFGGRKIAESEEIEGIWFLELSKYIKDNQLNWTFWCLNPESHDTGGIIKSDWISVEEDKQNLLTPLQYPFIK
ncbi:glycoside hydrolase family 5 protein [Clostridium thermarum]|uniref:glycoside hydrolase family 5 protein n=1 Tax=Clostridium thermarum TaxID=1716543 RepID=UPI00193F9474|nr:glycoside hydrolase family 5 protein [Clostridium thermarum]